MREFTCTYLAALGALRHILPACPDRLAHPHTRCVEEAQEDTIAWAGLDRTYYAGIERGERNPSVKQLAKIAHALAVPIATLFTEESAGE